MGSINGCAKVTVLFLCLAVVVFNGQSYPQEPDIQYQVIELGEYTAEAINDSGQVVMWNEIVTDVGYQTRSYLWDNGELTLLPSGDISTQCSDINNNSYVVGTVNGGGPVRWDDNGSFTVLDIPEGYSGWYTSAAGINDSNTIVGYLRCSNENSSIIAYIYNGQMMFPIDSGDEEPYILSDFGGINKYGDVVGWKYLNNREAILWSNGGLVSLGSNFMATDINNLGHIAGIYTPPGSGSWVVGNQAIKWINNTPYLYDNGDYVMSQAFAINDSSVMVGHSQYPYSISGFHRDRAVAFVEYQIIDLNTRIPGDSEIMLTKAVDINNNGEILAHGSYLGQFNSFLLRPSASDITYPSLDDLLIAGIADTIRWNVGSVGQTIDLEYTVDGGTTYRAINSEEIAAEDGEYEWAVPDSLIYRHVLIKMTDHDTGDSLAVSEEFRIKPYIITRVGDDGEYEAYEFDTHRWGFENNDYEVWPSTWWTQFDYQTGIDRFTNMPYTFYPLYLPFTTAQRSDFPDWESFVNAFTVAACYDNPALGYYNLSALNRWESIRDEWGGSCFGMANANALAFVDQDGFRRKYPGYPNYVNPVDVFAGPAVIPVISELFTYQYGNPYKAHDIERRANSYPTETVEQLKQIFSEDDVSVKALAIYNNNGDGGHEILPYRLEQDRDDPEYYYIYLWDNSYTTYEEALISVDTSFNGNRGYWDAAYGFIDAENWGGEKYLFLDIPASEFLSNPTLAKPASPQDVFAVPAGRLEITTTVTASTLITDAEGNQIGSDIAGDIPDAYPLTIRNGSETPPYGYQLPDGAYTIELNDFTEDSAKLFFFTEDGTFTYKRTDVLPGQTDRVSFKGGMSIMNPDAEFKAVDLAYTSDGPEKETLFAIQSLILSADDSVHVEPDAEHRLILKSYGNASSYDVVVGSVSHEGIEVFEHTSIPLSGDTSHILAPNWTEDTGDQLKILIDKGNDGSIDDSLFVENMSVGVNEDESEPAPDSFRLNQNYPNPFNPTTTISYALPSRSHVRLTVYNATGQQVRSYDLGVQDTGNHDYVFDGSGMPSGVYLYRVEAGGNEVYGRMLLMK